MGKHEAYEGEKIKKKKNKTKTKSKNNGKKANEQISKFSLQIYFNTFIIISNV